MNEIHADPVLDMKTLFAIYTDPDGVSIIGAWNGVKMLAASDPEGCVRMTSGLPMDTAMLAGLAAPSYRNGWPDPDCGL